MQAYIRKSYPIPEKLSEELGQYVSRLEELYIILHDMDSSNPEYLSLLWEYEDKSEWLGILAKKDKNLSQNDFNSLYFRYYIG